MKLLGYILAGFVALVLAALLITGGRAPESNPFVFFAFVALFFIPTVGAFWMMYMSIRYERSPLPIVLLAFIPFTFVWYYFDRVRARKLQRKRDSA